MREILIDVSRLLDRFLKGRLATGVDRVSLAYLQHFSGRARAVVRFRGRTLLLPKSASSDLFSQLLNPSTDFAITVQWLVARAYFTWQNTAALHGAFLFNTGHNGLEQAEYAVQLRHQQVRPVFVVHDLIPISHPEYCRAGELAKHVTRMNAVLSLASGVIANSMATLEELERYALQTGQTMPPAIAALLAAPAFPMAASARPMAEPYFVILSTIEPRKNHWLLLQLWRRLVETMGPRAPRLVVIGQRGWECENVVDLLERCASLHGVVTELPACSDADLATYLQHAQALLFPSFAEGYGMPLVEALAAGVPVIASDLAVFREIAGAIPDYLDPLDGMGWMQAIASYASTDSAPRAAQLARLAHFVAPTWVAHFEQVETLLERLA